MQSALYFQLYAELLTSSESELTNSMASHQHHRWTLSSLCDVPQMNQIRSADLTDISFTGTTLVTVAVHNIDAKSIGIL